MTLRNQTPLTIKPMGVTDTVDGTNGAPGSMASLQNLVPAMHTRNVFVPRPASTKIVDTAPGEALVEIGDRVYGFTGPPAASLWGTAIWGQADWQSAVNIYPGKSVPFCYDFSTQSFVTISGLSSDNLPNPAPATGDWTPPTITKIGGYILFTHPGFSLPHAFGWLDETFFRDTATGNTGYNALSTPADEWGTAIWGSARWTTTNPGGGKVITDLSKNVLLAGWRPGMIITDTGNQFPADTRIVDIAPDGLSITLSAASIGTPMQGDNLTVRGGTTQQPLWSSGNMAIDPLVAVPSAIASFGGRAYYAVKNAVVFSQAGDPLTPPPTTINNALTLENGLDITALTTQPFNNSTVAGGIVQALLVWQGDSSIWQITGDAAFGTLALNFLSPLGSLAPLTILTTPIGTIYEAPDGTRIIQLDGTVSEPIGANGDGVALPFVNVIYPSRMAAAYNEDVYRVSTTYNIAVGGSPIPQTVSNEFWYHIKLKAWSGPHTFPAALITASDRESTNHGYVLFPINATGMWFSNSRPLIDSGYVENGQQLSWVYQTTLQPDTGAMFMNAMLETAIMVSQPPTGSITVTALDEASNQIDQVTVNGFAPANAPPVTPAAIWGQAIWGQSVWGVGTAGALMMQRPLNWHTTLVFKQMSLQLTGASSSANAAGNVYMRYQRTGYMLQDLALAS